jgi:hypothetical protein
MRGLSIISLVILTSCSGSSVNINTPSTTPTTLAVSSTTSTTTIPLYYWADSIRIDGPKIEEFSGPELEQQVIECKPDISELTLELVGDQSGWNFEKVDANIYDDQEYDSAQQAWDANEILYFSYNFLGPYKGDYKQQIQIGFGTWKPIGGTSRLSDVKLQAVGDRRSDYVFQLSPKNNFAMIVAYGTDQGPFITESIPLGKIGPVETFVMQLVACGIPYWVSS